VGEAAEDPRQLWGHTRALRDLCLSTSERVLGRGGAEGSMAQRARRPQFDAAGREVGALHETLCQFSCVIPKARAATPLLSLARRAAAPRSAAALESPEALLRMRGVFSSYQERPASDLAL